MAQIPQMYQSNPISSNLLHQIRTPQPAILVIMPAWEAIQSKWARFQMQSFLRQSGWRGKKLRSRVIPMAVAAGNVVGIRVRQYVAIRFRRGIQHKFFPIFCMAANTSMANILKFHRKPLLLGTAPGSNSRGRFF